MQVFQMFFNTPALGPARAKSEAIRLIQRPRCSHPVIARTKSEAIRLIQPRHFSGERSHFFAQRPHFSAERSHYFAERPPFFAERPPFFAERSHFSAERSHFFDERSPFFDERPHYFDERPHYFDERSPFSAHRRDFLYHHPPVAADSSLHVETLRATSLQRRPFINRRFQPAEERCAGSAGVPAGLCSGVHRISGAVG